MYADCKIQQCPKNGSSTSQKKVQGKTKNLINNIRDDKNKNHSIRKNKIKYIYLFLDLQYKM